MGYGFNHEGKTFSPDATPPIVETREACDARNAETSRAEVEAFKTRAADRWFGYWGLGDGKRPVIRTFMGECLATVIWNGLEYSVWGFGTRSFRVNFRARGIDGRMWAGTYYKSSGDYVRMRVVKG